MDTIDMLKVEEANLTEIEVEQLTLNTDRLALLEQLKSLRPPESTKSAVYKWFEAVKLQTQQIKDLSAAYLNTLRMNYETSNQAIINQIESRLVSID